MLSAYSKDQQGIAQLEAQYPEILSSCIIPQIKQQNGQSLQNGSKASGEDKERLKQEILASLYDENGTAAPEANVCRQKQALAPPQGKATNRFKTCFEKDAMQQIKKYKQKQQVIESVHSELDIKKYAQMIAEKASIQKQIKSQIAVAKLSHSQAVEQAFNVYVSKRMKSQV